jgi:hypothetical protein
MSQQFPDKLQVPPVRAFTMVAAGCLNLWKPAHRVLRGIPSLSSVGQSTSQRKISGLSGLLSDLQNTKPSGEMCIDLCTRSRSSDVVLLNPKFMTKLEEITDHNSCTMLDVEFMA